MTHPTEPIERELPLRGGDPLAGEYWTISVGVTTRGGDHEVIDDAFNEIASLPREREVCELVQQLSEAAHRFREECLEA